MTAEPMIARGAHYTALLDTIDHQGATKLHARERERLLEAADVLLFGEPDSEQTVRWAELLIEALQTSKRWPVESCDQLREHLDGCGARTTRHRRNPALGPPSLERGPALCPLGAVAGAVAAGRVVRWLRRGTPAPAAQREEQPTVP
ncbi:MAG: hypothetical protein ACXVHX_31320 [Solirubrobacteraceae bacterium]